MSTTLGEAKAAARALLKSGAFERALHLYEQVLAAVPLDYETRLKVADALARAGHTGQAVEVYRAVALHDAHSGHPLPAIVAAKAIEALEPAGGADDIYRLICRLYAAGSPHLARFAVRPAPVDPATPLELSTAPAARPEEVARRARERALDVSFMVSYQDQYHPIPFLSELGPEPLLAVLRSLSARRLEDGALVTRQGDRGDALYLIAAGQVRVFAAAAGAEREIARLYENTLFGEMAIITGQTRSASVAAVDEADVVEVRRDALAHAAETVPGVADALDRFARERLIKNLLATSPLFTPFTKAQQSDLLRRFEGHEVEAGTEIIRAGTPGQGLYVVLNGEVEVIAPGEASPPVAVARLGAGEVFGEMSLVNDQPTSATVRAATRSSLLFLASAYFHRLVAAVPEVRSYFEALTLARARDNTLRLGPAVISEVTELDESDVIVLV